MTKILPATYARTIPYGDRKGQQDPTTATCTQHKVASPQTDDGRGYAEPFNGTADCVICGTEGADLIGTPVISRSHDGIYIYGGADRHGDGWSSLNIGVGSGVMAVLSCRYTHVAPADTLIPDTDARVTVEKMPKRRDYQDSGVWALHIEGMDDSKWSWFKTKRDAVQTGLRRVTIVDWHEGRST